MKEGLKNALFAALGGIIVSIFGYFALPERSLNIKTVSVIHDVIEENELTQLYLRFFYSEYARLSKLSDRDIDIDKIETLIGNPAINHNHDYISRINIRNLSDVFSGEVTLFNKSALTIYGFKQNIRADPIIIGPDEQYNIGEIRPDTLFKFYAISQYDTSIIEPFIVTEGGRVVSSEIRKLEDFNEIVIRYLAEHPLPIFAFGFIFFLGVLSILAISVEIILRRFPDTYIRYSASQLSERDADRHEMIIKAFREKHSKIGDK